MLILSTVSFLQVDETKVEIVRTFNPSNQDLEEYSYPRPGKEVGLNEM